MTHNKDVILEVKNLSKSYGTNKVLNNVSFKVFKGDILAIIGPSGSGKSTLMNILSRSIPYEQASIKLANRQIEDYKSNKEYAKKIGVIRQQFDLVEELEVIHNVLAGNLHRWGFWTSIQSLFFPQEKDQALQALDKVGIKDKAYQLTASLSGGEQQRVAIARLIIQQPDILLADEPIASLDPMRADSIIRLLKELALEENKTLIASMHSVHHVKKHFNRLIGIKNGQILLDERVENVTEEELNALYELEGGTDETFTDALS